jgi:hypothetical protein
VSARKCGHPLGDTTWCPDCELAEARSSGEFRTWAIKPAWKNNRMNPWVCTLTPHQARRIGKTVEELGELMAV